MCDIVEEARGLLEMGARMVDAGTVGGLLDRIVELERLLAAEQAGFEREHERLRKAMGTWEGVLIDAVVARLQGDYQRGYDKAIADVCAWFGDPQSFASKVLNAVGREITLDEYARAIVNALRDGLAHGASDESEVSDGSA